MSEIRERTIEEIDTSKEIEILKRIEAALFVSGKWLSIQELINLTDLNPILLKQYLEKLKERYGDKSAIDCAAYEPTKEFRELVRNLRIGDDITVYGGVRKSPLTINIEKMKINKLVDYYKKSGNPKSPKCKKKMKSMGKRAGYRCPVCRIKTGEDTAPKKKEKRKIKEGFYEVPVCARRHLAKPLKRIKT